MSIETTYKTLLTEDFIKEELGKGNAVSAITLENQITTEFADKDLSIPQFKASTFHTSRLESSSATKKNSTFLAMRQDLRALYKNMLELTDVSLKSFERWGLEAENIEKELIDLEERISNLLILTQDTEGFHSILIDNFTDTSKIDLDFTTAELDLQSASIEMGASTGTFNRIFLNDVLLPDDATFKVRTTVNFLARIDAVNALLSNPFEQESETWWTNITMKKREPVVTELTVRLNPDAPITINKIFMELHDSAESSPVSITPLFSTDNVNFLQLPTNTFTIEARTTATFSFSDISAKWIKFILTKRGPDPSSSTEFFSYQFGFKNIKFFTQGFSSTTKQFFVSEPLSVRDIDLSDVLQFERLTLETCERIETNTAIDYFITTSNTPIVPLTVSTDINTTAQWLPITPVNRSTATHPKILDVGEVFERDIGDTETVQISYDGRATDTDFINPAQTFQLLSKVSAGLQDVTVTSTVPRYNFVNSNDRILNYQIKDVDYTGSTPTTGTKLEIEEANVVIFRNVGAQSLDATDVSTKVREIQRGWRFQDPFYTCVIEIQNPDGMEIDVGDKPIVIDDVSYTNKINGTVLTGKTATTDGIHKIKVHKKNWVEIVADAVSLSDLKTKDPLYPFNHKLLIEGYIYVAAYPSTDEQIYQGADVFAETTMKKVSPFDIAHNIAVDNYTVYTLDRDVPNSHAGTNSPTRVFLLKIDENNPDFQNERFVIRFKEINLLQKYLRLRADFSTSDTKVSPELLSYKIKLG